MWWNVVWLSDKDSWDDTQRDVTSYKIWHMIDVECDSILSCDCSYNEDSSKCLLRLSIKDK